MLLRAINTKDELVNFDLSDCPVQVTDGLYALAAIPNSPLLVSQTITRGDPETSIFEGDIVYEDGEYVGYIIYKQGFKIQKDDGTLKDLELNSHIKVEIGNIDSMRKVCNNSNRDYILLSYHDKVISMNLFLYKMQNGRIAVIGKSYTDGRSIDPKKLKHYTGCEIDGRKLFYGDIFEGKTLVLKDFKPYFYKDGEYEEVIKQ